GHHLKLLQVVLLSKNSSNDENDVGGEDGVDVVTIVDVVGAGKSEERGIGIDSKDGIIGKGGIDVGEVVGMIKSNEVDVISDEVDIGVESMVGVDVDIDGER
ncbi:hypothetical protein KI387_039985, partial [Taxus chinensis]